MQKCARTILGHCFSLLPSSCVAPSSSPSPAPSVLGYRQTPPVHLGLSGPRLSSACQGNPKGTANTT